LLSEHQDAVERLADVPGPGVWTRRSRSSPKSVPPRRRFPPRNVCPLGASPGDNETAGVNYSHRSPKGNRHMRRLLNQAANAAARTKGSIFEIVYRRTVPRLGPKQTIGAIAHRQCRLIWLILHQGVLCEERGPALTKQSKQRRTARMIRQLRSLVNGFFARGEYLGLSDDSTQGFQSNYSALFELYITTCALAHSQR